MRRHEIADEHWERIKGFLPGQEADPGVTAADNDDVQLCAQALCLEEMLGVAVPKGAVYHEASKNRREVEFTPGLRAETEATVARLHALLAAGTVPPAVVKPQCRGCSLRGHCLPDVFGKPGRVAAYLRALFRAPATD